MVDGGMIMKKIIILGLGSTAEVIERKLSKEHKIVGYSDSRAKIKIYKGKPFIPFERLQNSVFDYIIITTQNREVAFQLWETLIQEYKIEKNKIIPFYIYADSERYRNVMNRWQGELVGIILGNSHARDGILTDYLSFPFVNFAMGSQDIYSCLKIFQRCIKEYPDKLSNLKIVLMDLWDYNCFNWDCSMTSKFASYLSGGGVIDRHNYEKNKNCKSSFMDDLRNNLHIINDKMVKTEIKKLFADCSGRGDFSGIEWEREHKYIEKTEPIPMKRFFADVVKKRFDSTIKENKENIEKLCREIKNYNSEIKIVFILIPRYITIEEVLKPFMKEWKAEFEEYMGEICKKYDASFWDLKSRTDISGNNYFYYNISHLNIAGGISLTSIIDEYLKGLLH